MPADQLWSSICGFADHSAHCPQVPSFWDSVFTASAPVDFLIYAVAAALMEHRDKILAAAASHDDGAVFRACRDLRGDALDAARVVGNARVLAALAGASGEAALRGQALPETAASTATSAVTPAAPRKAGARPRFELRAVAAGSNGGGSGGGAVPHPGSSTAAAGHSRRYWMVPVHMVTKVVAAVAGGARWLLTR